MKYFILFLLLSCSYAIDPHPDIPGKDPLDMIEDLNSHQGTMVTAKLPDSIAALASKHMVDGTVTSVADYPFMCGLMALEDHDESRFCACVIITSMHVLTAAQCAIVVRPNQVGVHLGSNFSFGGGVKYYVSFITIHPDYDSRSGTAHDLAVLRLGEKLHFGPTIQAAKLPTPGTEVPDNTPVKQVGWGATSRSALTSGDQLVLMEYEIFTMGQKMCSEVYDHMQEYTGLNSKSITSGMICAAKPGRQMQIAESSECHADTGGPMIYMGVVVGISSLGMNCAGNNYPAIHTKVAKYIEWINHVISVPHRHHVIHHESGYRFGGRSPGSMPTSVKLASLLGVVSVLLLQSF